MKKIIDKNGRLFGVVSIIDILFVIIVAALAVACYMKFFVLNKTDAAAFSSAHTTKIVYTVKTGNVRDYTVDSIQVGDSLYSGSTYVGTVASKEVVPATSTMALPDGTFIVADVEDYYNVIISLEVDGIVTNDRYYASRTYEVSVGASISLCSKYSSFSGFITEIKE